MTPAFMKKRLHYFISDECKQAFDELRKKLIESPILVVPNWDYDFEIMCDASDFALGAVLGQRKDLQFSILFTMRVGYGKLAITPKRLEHKAFWALKQTNLDLNLASANRKSQINELNELRDEAYENSLLYKEKTKRLHDSKIKNRVFNVGDQVLLFNSRLKIFSGKLKSRWSRPYTIANVFPYGTIELFQKDGQTFKVNGHRVKHYFGEDVPKEIVPDVKTDPP
ncbi:reverse transcriptase domain-containing protein [Tanacetum coccineum]|uniref:Reverse transcriptase domain-containing protein n=1 Tax=Tanacetum coccineum TaxID=301880 RepID=A0ABQ4YIJ4_9ASTR